MKTSILAVLMLFATGLFAQADITDQVVVCFKTANSKELAKYFTESIDVAIDSEAIDDIYSRGQAEQIMKKFFDKNKPSGFTIKHSGKTQLDIEYRIGELETSGGTFRVQFQIFKVGDVYQIKKLEITKM